MLKGLLELTWLELKIFLREPMGAFSTIFAPVGLYMLYGSFADRNAQMMNDSIPAISIVGIALSSMISLVIIVAVYREGGILKRQRATPLRPYTILAAHFLAKLLLTSIAISVIVLTGIFYYGVQPNSVAISFVIAFIISTISLVSMGFIVASFVPTARLAQPISAFVFYPMIFFTGMFYDLGNISPGLKLVSSYLPMSLAYKLMSGVWQGNPLLDYIPELLILTAMTFAFIAISSKIFKWE